MPYNPISGQFEYGGETYDAPTMGVGMAMEGMGAVGADIPLAFRMMENMPGIAASFGFSARRFSNTMFNGGFLDVADGTNARKVARARKFGAFVGDTVERPNASGFLFGRMRNAEKLATKTQFAKASRINNLSPRAFNRFSSISALSGVPDKGFYTPFQASGLLNTAADYFNLRGRLISRGAISADETRPLFSGGVLGRMTTMMDVNSMENKLLKLEGKSSARAIKKRNKIIGQLESFDTNTSKILKSQLTNFGDNIVMSPGAQNVVQAARGVTRTGSTRVGMQGLSARKRLEFARAVAEAEPEVVKLNRLRAISDTSSGVLTRRATEYFGNILDPSKFVGTRAYEALEKNISSVLKSRLQGGPSGAVSLADASAVQAKAAGFLRGTEVIDDLGKYGVRSLGKLTGEAFASGQKRIGVKLAAATGLKAIQPFIKPLNVLATASLVYDLTKLAAMPVVAAGNFAKDAVKSMQGSIHKPAFGMGYKDNEVAATSRARGVMAIQNSRLNARSSLGSEASMMAAHFG